ncbi:MAG: hypothetical protein N2166_05415 [candidate division WOR-3 bacterium]|nr:hypothetical protein [candidate division WOR-3 bacterium]
MAQILSFEEMDQAARQAEEELKQIDPQFIEPIAAWWFKWYLKAGHKRLGRILIKKYKEKTSAN